MYSLAIVDDEKELREGLAYHFPWEAAGFRVRAVCASAREALEFFSAESADVLLTDIRMPGMSGLDLIRRIKETGRERTLFCLLSAYRDFEYAKEGISLGVRHYLLKPTDFDEIGAAFAEIRRELDAAPPAEIEGDQTASAVIREARAIISARPETCSLAFLAEKLGVNPSYLSRSFKEQTGENFHEFLLKIKMAKAGEMLRSTVVYTNKEISSALGYQDSQNFCRSFRKHFGLTPGEFRARRGAE